MSSILIKNATILTMCDNIFKGDILIDDDRIISVSTHVNSQADKVIDATR